VHRRRSSLHDAQGDELLLLLLPAMDANLTTGRALERAVKREDE